MNPFYVSSAITAFAIPIFVAIFSHHFPPASNSEFDLLDIENLKARNNWIDWAASILSVLGLGTSVLFIPLATTDARKLLPATAGFALMIWLPVIFVSLVTLPQGKDRLREFLRWYELKHKLGLRGVAFILMPICALTLGGCLFFFLTAVVP